MPQIFLSIGSNINRQENIARALDELAQVFSFLRISSVYQTPAVGFEGDDFYNLAVAAHTLMSPTEVNEWLKTIEKKIGRTQQEKGFSSRTIDIDLLTYGEYLGMLDDIEFPRKETFEYAFVLAPLVEIAGEQMCPGTRKTYVQLWTTMQKSVASMHKINFIWKDELSLPLTYSS